jgi:acyl carrier protein
MQAVLGQVKYQYGSLNGVIHAVALGAAQLFKPIQDMTLSDCEQQFHGKISGLFVLQELLKSEPLDFCLLISSLASLFGGFGHAAYAAANLFMDTFVHQHNQTNPVPWLSINWDGRKPISSEGEAMPLVETNPELTILPEEDIEIFRRVLAWSQLDQIIVSTRDLQPRIARWTTWELLRKQADIRADSTTSKYTRPGLENAYVSPRNEMEKALADIWQTIIGIYPVGIHDNFFELGGDSLISIQVIAKIRETLYLDLPTGSLFEAPTVAGMTSYIDGIRAAEQLQTSMSQASEDREELDL